MFLRGIRSVGVQRLNSFTMKSNKCLLRRFASLPNRELSIKTAEQLPTVGQTVKSIQQNRLLAAKNVSIYVGWHCVTIDRNNNDLRKPIPFVCQVWGVGLAREQ